MSTSNDTRSDEREGQAAPRNFPRDDVPRKYHSREAAESVAETYALMNYFVRRGAPYVYECQECQAHHVGLNTKNQPWHAGRYRHDQHLDHKGQRPDESAA